LFTRIFRGTIVRALRVFAGGVFALILLASVSAGEQNTGVAERVEGVVRDSSGAVVVGAQVDVRAGSFSASVVTGAGGAFAFENVAGAAGTLSVTAKGFRKIEQAWRRADGQAVVHVEIVLTPATVSQQVQVTDRKSVV
jgi:hypothetical protein